MVDCCVIGGGVIGLSIARELASRGKSVQVLTQEDRKSTTSWAAAGILPPVSPYADATSLEQLTLMSDRIHYQWSRELLEETGINNGLLRCGGLHIARTSIEFDELRNHATTLHQRNIRCEIHTTDSLCQIEPGLRYAVSEGLITGGLFTPDEAQIRTPRHLEALRQSCLKRNVEILDGASVHAMPVKDGRITHLECTTTKNTSPRIDANTFCIAAGAWSGKLVETLDISLHTKPVRGQIALLQLPQPTFARVINIGLRGVDYLLPRTDGKVLVGSTLENAGFDKSTTREAIERLLNLATNLLGAPATTIHTHSWSGLRPGSSDGIPSIGSLPGYENVYIATGHFRAGMHQSTGTAVLIADLVTGNQTAIDLVHFAPDRQRSSQDPLMPH
jgi:glycine oxidase